MRILLTTDTVGGVWDHCVTLARGLHDAGCEVLLAALGEPRDERLAALPAGVQVVSRPYRLEWMAGAGADVEAAGEWLRGLAVLWNADVAHLNQMAYAAAGLTCPVLTVVHSDVLSWFAEVEGREAPPEWGAYAGWVREGLAASDVVAAPTAYQGERVLRHFGRAVDRVIHNGVVPPPLAAAEGDDAPPPVVLSVGRAWDEAKGVHVLDGALEILGESAPEAHLLGETRAPHGDEVVPRCLATYGRVERSEVDAWMERAGIYVAPSLYEPFGLAPLEAALRGCALVLSDIGSFREVWQGCAAFFPRGDAGALAEVLAELRDSPRRRAQLASAARTRALRRYGADRMVAAYAALYREMVEAHREHGPRARTLAAAS